MTFHKKVQNLILSFTFVLVGFSYLSVAEAPLPKKPQAYVSDTAGVINPQTRVQLEALLNSVKQQTRAEIVVVTLPKLEGREINEYATSLFETWGIGEKGKDNGVLLLVAPSDRKVRIEVGYGLEGVLPDGLTGRILDEVVLPSFKQNDYSQGIYNGAAVMSQLVAKEAGVQLRVSPQIMRRSAPPRKASLLQTIISIAFFILMIPIVIRHPWLLFFLLSGGRGGGYGGGGGFGGGFGGFGGGMSGGGGSFRSW